MKKHAEEIWQKPDLFFSKYCEEKFDINKGVYNTIDCWFYEQGLEQITERRKTILSFFQYLHLIEKTNHKIKFGPRGLTTKLNQYWEKNHQLTCEHTAI